MRGSRVRPGVQKQAASLLESWSLTRFASGFGHDEVVETVMLQQINTNKIKHSLKSSVRRRGAATSGGGGLRGG